LGHVAGYCKYSNIRTCWFNKIWACFRIPEELLASQEVLSSKEFFLACIICLNTTCVMIISTEDNIQLQLKK
jgi:hypothetical protein